MNRPDWLPPLLVLIVAFCAGAQLSYLFLPATGHDYFRDGVEFKFITFALLIAGTYMLLTPGQRARLRGLLPLPSPNAETALPPPPASQAPQRPPSGLQMNTPPSVARAPAVTVRLTLDTPLTRGPVWPPGEPLPVTVNVHAQGGTLPDDLDVELELRHQRGTERARVPLRGCAAVLSQTVPAPGTFTLTARVLRDGVELAKASAEGRATTYREEIGRRFDVLKVAASQAGLDVGPEATPRELRDALARRNPKLRSALEEMVAALEVALYAEEEVGREPYESLVRALQEIERRGMEAVPRA